MTARPQREAGFTLIEVLTVLIIIGLMTSIVILTVPTPKSTLDKQAEFMVGSLNQLAQNSIITGKVSAAGFSQLGYVLYEYADDEWQELSSNEWGESYRLRYTRADARLDVPEDAAPSILFQPTGLSTPFELVMSDNDREYTLVTSGDGRVVLHKDQ